VYQLPITLWCSVCRQEHPRTLNLPDDVALVGTPHFSCARCNGGERYHAPHGWDTAIWISKVASLGWRCGSCHRSLDLESLREFENLPICVRCRTSALRSGFVIGQSRAARANAAD
jgi:hypothetical protein